MPSLKQLELFQKIFDKVESPIAWSIGIVLILFLIWRKFTTTEYVTAGKLTIESLNTLCNQLQEENKVLQEQIKNLKEELKNIKIPNDNDDGQISTDNQSDN